jgi:ABC-type branched-subunit amino acid transport system ATPase component
MFGMSSADHVHAVYRYDEEKRRSADNTLEELGAELRVALSGFEHAIGSLDESGRPSSLLHDKLALAIERLVPRPNLLILDEPSWGLSDVLGRQLIQLIVREAHKRNVPVAIISHEIHWLEHLYNSRLELRSGDSGLVEVIASAV